MGTDALIGAMIGGNILSAYLGSSASGRAADTQSQAAIEAAKLQAQTAQQWINYLQSQGVNTQQLEEQMYLQGRQDVAPWREVGGSAVLTLADLLQPEGYLAQGYPEFTGQMQFNKSDVTADPGFAFRMAEGTKAIERSAAARGGLLSGATAKSLERFAQDYSSNEYQNAYARTYGEASDKYNQELERYRTNYAVTGQNQQNLFNRLSSLAGYGAAGAGATANLGEGYATNASNLAQQTAQNSAALGTSASRSASDYLTSAAAARASGYVGSANAWSNAAGNMGNNLLLWKILNG